MMTIMIIRAVDTKEGGRVARGNVINVTQC